jgi:outer membrane beta-barrel protein
MAVNLRRFIDDEPKKMVFSIKLTPKFLNRYTRTMKINFSLLLLTVMFSTFTSGAYAQTATPTPGATRANTRAEKLNLEQIQNKYLGNASNEIQVVQNRKYTKAGKLEIGLLGGWVSADPFLNINAYGAFIGYHFSESIGVRALYWKESSSNTSGYTEVQTQDGIVVNTSAPKSLVGGEFQFTPVYGKVSLLGSSIVYYDLSLFAGVGRQQTESFGQTFNAITPIVGIGQQFFFGKIFSVGVDYRILHYSETVIDGQPASSTYGKSTGTRDDFSHILFLSLSIFLG